MHLVLVTWPVHMCTHTHRALYLFPKSTINLRRMGLNMCAPSLNPVRLFVTPRTVPQVPLSMEHCRQEHWSGLSFPTPAVLPNPGIEHTSLGSPASAGGFSTFPLCHLGNPGLNIGSNR